MNRRAFRRDVAGFLARAPPWSEPTQRPRHRGTASAESVRGISGSCVETTSLDPTGRRIRANRRPTAQGENMTQQLRVLSFGVSLDGYGAGLSQTLDHPFGARGLELHELYPTRTFQRRLGDTGADGTTGSDDELMSRGSSGIGATIMGRNMFGRPRRLARRVMDRVVGDEPAPTGVGGGERARRPPRRRRVNDSAVPTSRTCRLHPSGDRPDPARARRRASRRRRDRHRLPMSLHAV
jgi:hypothetical protein